MFSTIDQVMQRYVDAEILPGVSFMILKGSDIVHEGHIGFSDIESKTPLGPDAIFRIASNTKLITFVVLMMLYERGIFDLDDPLANYLPEFTDMKVLRPNASRIHDVAAALSPIRSAKAIYRDGCSRRFAQPYWLNQRLFGYLCFTRIMLA